MRPGHSTHSCRRLGARPNRLPGAKLAAAAGPPGSVHEVHGARRRNRPSPPQSRQASPRRSGPPDCWAAGRSLRCAGRLCCAPMWRWLRLTHPMWRWVRGTHRTPHWGARARVSRQPASQARRLAAVREPGRVARLQPGHAKPAAGWAAGAGARKPPDQPQRQAHRGRQAAKPGPVREIHRIGRRPSPPRRGGPPGCETFGSVDEVDGAGRGWAVQAPLRAHADEPVPARVAAVAQL
jgi:hypothetical protein